MDDTFDIALFIKNREILDKVYNATIGNTLAYARYLKDLEEQGVNVEVIDLALDSVDRLWEEKTGASAYFIHYQASESALKSEKAIKNALEALCRLPPIFSQEYREILKGNGISPEADNEILMFNEALEEMQDYLKGYKKLIKKYLDIKLLEQTYRLDDPTGKLEVSGDLFARLLFQKPIDVDKIRDWMKMTVKMKKCDDIIAKMGKKRNRNQKEKLAYLKANKEIADLKSKMHLNKSTRGVWGEAIVKTVDELKRAGFAPMKAYQTTANILKLRFPTAYTDTDPNLIRQQYKYHKKK